MKKVLLLGGLFLLCGCESIIDKGIDVSNNTKYSLAKNSIYKYVEGIKVAYTNYQYSSALSEYNANDGVNVVVDGKTIKLDINYTGDEIVCDKTAINSGKIELNNCSIYGYTFDYVNGDVVDK